MAEALFAAMKPGADGKKVIGVVNGTAGTSVAIDRRKGLAEAITEDGNVKIAGEVDGNFVRDQSQTVFEVALPGASRHQGRLGGQRRRRRWAYRGAEE